MKKILFMVFLSYSVFVRGAETNLFVTDDGFLIWDYHNQIKMNPQKVEEAKKSRESLPAAQYPEGNWGSAQGGFQLSIRFEKTSFTNSEPIVATILLRNVTNQILNYPVINEFGKDGPINLAMIDNKGSVLPSGSDDIAIISQHDSQLYPGTQKKFIERLSNEAVGTNTSFSVYANLTVSCPHCVQVKSANVPIKIE